MIWFTSDLHLGHKNIIEHCKRPFRTVEEMDDTLINNWNEVVGIKDTVYVLGDFCMNRILVEKFLFRLKGHKIFIRGNHDEFPRTVPMRDVYMLKHDTQNIWLSHYAHRVWPKSHHGSWHLYGHSHGGLSKGKEVSGTYSLSMDVGVDAHAYFPISYDQVKEIMEKKIAIITELASRLKKTGE